jgi:threonine dehydrogenase-like Zn-dependent dehydrogenase
MRGVVFTGERELDLMEFPDPAPGPGEVVLEMKASGMCGSDLHQYRRPKSGGSDGGIPRAAEPVIAGHEPAGVVAAVGARVIAVDVAPEQLARATEFGADAAIDPGSDDPVAAIAALTQGRSSRTSPRRCCRGRSAWVCARRCASAAA